MTGTTTTALPPGAAAHMDAALAGDTGAQAALDAAYRAHYGEGEATAETAPPRQPDRAPAHDPPAGDTSVPGSPGASPRAPQAPGEATPGSTPSRTSRDGAQARIAARQADPAFMQRCADGDAAALAELDGLYRLAWPGEPDEGGQAYTFEPSPEGWEPDQAHREAAVATFTALGVSPDDARELEGIYLAAATRDLSEEAQRAMMADTHRALAEELGGEAQAQAFIAGARELVKEAERTWPGLRNLLLTSGAGSDLELVRAVGMLAERRKGPRW